MNEASSEIVIIGARAKAMDKEIKQQEKKLKKMKACRLRYDNDPHFRDLVESAHELDEAGFYL